MHSQTEKEMIIKKIENNRKSYEMNGDYETHHPILCMFTDKPAVHVYNEKADDEKYLNGWAVNVTLSNGDTISCLASHHSYDEQDIDDEDDFIFAPNHISTDSTEERVNTVEIMKINGLSTYQILEETADIALSVEFPKETVQKYELTAATVWVTYDLEGNFRHIEVAAEGVPVSFELNPPELKQVADYILENKLEDELMKRIFHKQLTAAGEMADHPLLEGYKRIDWVTMVYPKLSPFAIELSDNLYDYHIFENEQGERLMLEHTSNNNCRFICEGTEAAVTEHLKTMFPEVDLEQDQTILVSLSSYNHDSQLFADMQKKIETYEKQIQELTSSQQKEIGSVIQKRERIVVIGSVNDRIFLVENKLRKLKGLDESSLSIVEQKNRNIMLNNFKEELNLLSEVKSRLEQEMYNSAMGHNLKPTIEDVRDGLAEVLACTDGFYTQDNGRRLDPKLSDFAGYINVIRKVSADLLNNLK